MGTFLKQIYISNPLEFLVSELQAVCIIKHQELHPEDKTTGDESEKEQRAEDHSHEITGFCQEYEDNVSDNNGRAAEMQAEWILLLRALNMDAASQLRDVSNEVRLVREKLSFLNIIIIGKEIL